MRWCDSETVLTPPLSALRPGDRLRAMSGRIGAHDAPKAVLLSVLLSLGCIVGFPCGDLKTMNVWTSVPETLFFVIFY